MENGVNYAKSLVPGIRNQVGAEGGGKVRAIYDEFTFNGEAAGTIVNVGSLKKDEIFIGALLVSAALGAGVTLSLGDAVSDVRYIAATVCTAAVEAFKGAAAGVGYKATADTTMFLKTGVGAATGKVQIVIYKVCPN